MHLLVILCLAAGIVSGTGSFSIPVSYIGAGRHGTTPLELGASMPSMDVPGDGSWSLPENIPISGSIIGAWSERDIPDWKTQGKVTAPRVILAKLAAGTDLDHVNRYLLDAKPWSGAGSTWFLHQGDYDFSLVTLTTILYLFGNKPNRLFPETRAHLLEVLLNQEGGTPLVAVPNTFGLALDTENHHLMTEGSRYLKNQWLFVEGDESQRGNPIYDNGVNGLEKWLAAYLDEMIREGVYEFNSQPYIGYTLQALLNLDAFPASCAIRQKARYLLDIINKQYALGSLDYRRNPPFRRRYEKAGDTRLDDDPHTAYMQVWMRLAGDGAVPEGEVRHRYSGHGLLAELLPYRLPEDVRAWTRYKQEPYFVRFGRGPSACPELYSGGPGYLLSAGGAHRGLRSHIVAQPVTLLLEDGETDLMGCIHLRGKGSWSKWNTTGVYDLFGCSNGPVHIPEKLEPAVEADGWRIFNASTSGLLVAVYSPGDDFSLIALFPENIVGPGVLLKDILEANNDPDRLKTKFQRPGGGILEYDVDAPQGVWVMKSLDGTPLNRDYDTWAQFDGQIPALSFSRSDTAK